MAELFIKLIEDVGVDFSVQNITDDIPVCMHVEAKYPSILQTLHILHSLNLALKSIALNVT